MGFPCFVPFCTTQSQSPQIPHHHTTFHALYPSSNHQLLKREKKRGKIRCEANSACTIPPAPPIAAFTRYDRKWLHGWGNTLLPLSLSNAPPLILGKNKRKWGLIFAKESNVSFFLCQHFCSSTYIEKNTYAHLGVESAKISEALTPNWSLQWPLIYF